MVRTKLQVWQVLSSISGYDKCLWARRCGPKGPRSKPLIYPSLTRGPIDHRHVLCSWENTNEVRDTPKVLWKVTHLDKRVMYSILFLSPTVTRYTWWCCWRQRFEVLCKIGQTSIVMHVSDVRAVVIAVRAHLRFHDMQREVCCNEVVIRSRC